MFISKIYLQGQVSFVHVFSSLYYIYEINVTLNTFNFRAAHLQENKKVCKIN